MRFERPLRVRFGHCDPAGIVFFPQYFVMFNGLVEDWVTEGLGIPYHELIGPRRTGLPTVSLACDFHSPSRMGDVVTLALAVEKLGRSSITLALDCHCGDEVRVKARKVLVTTSLDTHRSVPLPPDLRLAIERFGAAV